MEFRVLQYFLAVAREESISKAAEVLHVTQPTLSRQIAQLEEELGASLFVRGKKTVLTDAGVMLRHRAEDISVLMDSIRTDFISRKDVAGELRIGSGVYAGSNALIGRMKGFMQLYPRVALRIFTASADELKEKLDHGILDFAVLMEPIDIGSYEFLRLPEKDRWGLLVAASSPLAEKDSVTREELAGVPLTMSHRAVLAGEFRNWLGDTKAEVLATGNLSDNFLPLVDGGFSARLVVEASTVSLDPARYRFIPLAPALATTTVLAWKKLSPVCGAAGEFLKYVKGEPSEI